MTQGLGFPQSQAPSPGLGADSRCVGQSGEVCSGCPFIHEHRRAGPRAQPWPLRPCPALSNSALGRAERVTLWVVTILCDKGRAVEGRTQRRGAHQAGIPDRGKGMCNNRAGVSPPPTGRSPGRGGRGLDIQPSNGGVRGNPSFWAGVGSGDRSRGSLSWESWPGFISISFAWPFILSLHSQPPQSPFLAWRKGPDQAPLPVAHHTAPPQREGQ